MVADLQTKWERCVVWELRQKVSGQGPLSSRDGECHPLRPNTSPPGPLSARWRRGIKQGASPLSITWRGDLGVRFNVERENAKKGPSNR
jgi:hypothetical protein